MKNRTEIVNELCAAIEQDRRSLETVLIVLPKPTLCLSECGFLVLALRDNLIQIFPGVVLS